MQELQPENLTLQNIRKILYEIIKHESAKQMLFNCISSIILVNDKDEKDKFKNYITSLAINNEGTLFLCISFLEKYIKDRDDLKCCLMHELLHQVLGDCGELKNFDKKDPELNLKLFASNIATDMRINAFLYYYMEHNNISNKVFYNIYTELGKEAEDEILYRFLRPASVFSPEEREEEKALAIIKHYEKLYDRKEERLIPYHQIYEAVLEFLRKNADKYCTKVYYITGKLLGGHQYDPEDGTIDADLGQGEDEDIDGEDLELKNQGENKGEEEGENEGEEENEEKGEGKYKGRKSIKEGVEEEIRQYSKQPGISSSATKSIISTLDGLDKKIDLNLFQRLSFNSLFTNVRIYNSRKNVVTKKSPSIPSFLSKRDMFLLMNNCTPILWKHKVRYEVKTKMMLPIYLDVSGSMNYDLPSIVNLITNIDKDLDYVWGFSNKIFKHTMEDLKKGIINSTGGTDFDCILDHREHQAYSDIVVITDGYAWCNRAKEKIHGLNDVILVLCTRSRNENNWFSEVYKNTKQIEEVTI